MLKRSTLAKLACAVVVVGAVAGGAASAHASTTALPYDVYFGPNGYTGLSGTQVKNAGGTNARLGVEYVQNSRTVGVILANASGGDAAGAVKHENVGAPASIPLENSVNAGQTVRLKFWGNPTWFDTTETTGQWKSN